MTVTSKENVVIAHLIEALLALAVGLAVFVVIALVLMIPTTLLWNYLCPVIFGLPSINVVQMLGLTILLRCLFYTPKRV
jgi:hypothetical protein